jgi:large subunit ribosomal protein L3
VTGIRTFERDGYEAVQLAFGSVREKHITKAELGHLRKADAPPMKHVVEFRDHAGELTVGETVTVEAFEPGQKVKVSGVSKGKGFQGTVKRHNFARGPVTHGSHNVRAPGSIGAAAYPARVFKGIRGPGQMGNKRVTQRGLEVVRVDAGNNLLMLRGSVPGPRNGVVEVRTDG